MADGSQFSPPLTNEVDSPLASRSASEGLSLSDIWRVIFKRKLVILALVAVSLVLGWLYSSTRVRLYQASATVDLNPSSTNVGLSDLIQQSLSSEDVRLPTEIARMQDNLVIFGTIKQLAQHHKGPFPHAFDKLSANATMDAFSPGEVQGMIGLVRGGLQIGVVPSTDIVYVNYRNPNPEIARDVPNTLINVYQDRNLEDHIQGTGRVTQWLSNEMTGLRDQASAAQSRLAEYQKQHNLVGGQNDSLILDRLRTENSQIANAQADRLLREAKLRIADTNDPDLIASSVPSQTLSAMRAQQLQLQALYDQYTTKYGVGYPRVRELKAQIAALQAQVDIEMRAVQHRLHEEYDTSSRTLRLLQNQLDTEMQGAYQLNQSAAQYALLRQDADSSRQLYDQLQLKLKESNLAAGLNTASISVIDQAVLPLGPVTPNVSMNLGIAAAMGLMAGLLLAFLLDSLDDTLRTTEDVETFSGLLSIGAIPHFQSATKGPKGAEKVESVDRQRIISLSAPGSPASEAYRALRSSILLSAIDNPLKTIVVTSAFMSEGKSTLSANIAVMLAQRGERVLIVDADLRRSTLHLLFGMQRPVQGLTNLLSRQTGDSVFLHPLPELPELTYLPAGVVPPNPAELLASQRMAEVMRQWAEQYDRIIIDTAPILAVSDSLAPAARADSVLLVVRAGVTRKKALLRTRELLRRVNAHLLGAVVNDVDMRKESYYNYSGPYSYGYGYTSDTADETEVKR